MRRPLICNIWTMGAGRYLVSPLSGLFLYLIRRRGARWTALKQGLSNAPAAQNPMGSATNGCGMISRARDSPQGGRPQALMTPTTGLTTARRHLSRSHTPELDDDEPIALQATTTHLWSIHRLNLKSLYSEHLRARAKNEDACIRLDGYRAGNCQCAI
jgi:hypothetical protein